MLTIVELKKFIKDLPDDGFVYHERIEDHYFKEKIIEDAIGKHETTPWEIKKMPASHWPDSGKKDEYIQVWSWVDYKDGHLYLTAHF